MTATDERQALRELAEEAGWEHRDQERVDVFTRRVTRVRVIWRGDNAISGSSQHHDDIMANYTRDLSTVKRWLKR